MSIDDAALGQARRMRLELDRTVDATTRAMAEAWSAAWDEVADEFAAAVDELLALGEGEWPSRRQVLRAERARRALASATEAVKRLALENGVTIVGALPDLTASAEDFTRRIVAAQYPDGELVDWARTDEKALTAMVKRTTGQVESLLHALPAEQAAVMKQALVRGVAVGDSPREAARQMLARLGGAFDGGRERALVIARTEMLDAHRRAALLARQANADILEGWRWTCNLVGRPCAACLSMHGRVFGVDEFGPEGHQQCRCSATPVTRTWRDLGFDIDEPDDVFPDARAWFNAQPASVQLDIMGEKRLAQLKSGRLAWDDLAVRQTNPGWRHSWVVAPVAA